MLFIRKKKLIKIISQAQKETRKTIQDIKKDYIKEKNDRKSRDMQLYEDGNDNAYNYILYIINKM